MKLLRRQNDRWNWAQVTALFRRAGLIAPAGKDVPGSFHPGSSAPSLLPYGFLLLLSVAVIIMVFVVGVFESRERMIAQASIQLRQKTALLEAYVSKILEANNMVLKSITAEIDPMPWPDIIASQTVQKLLATQKQYLKHSGAIALVDRSGNLVASSEGPWVQALSVTDRDYFRSLSSSPTDDTFIGEPVIGKLLEKPSLTMSKSLRRLDGKFDGLILITMPIEYFAVLFDAAASPSDAAQFLRGNGEVVINVPLERTSNAPPSWFAKAMAEDPVSGVIHNVSSPAGIRRMVAYRKVGEFPFYVTYGIDERALLEGWWQSVCVYGAVLAAALCAFLATAWLARRRSIALMHSNELLREVSERVLVSQDEERRSIARDLHDSTGQHLVAAGMELENARTRLVEADKEVLLSLTRTSTLISDSNEELRTLSYLLHPPMLDESGLPNALELLIAGFEDRSGIEIELRVSPLLETKRPPQGVELAIFRIVQEGLTNIYRHSRAKKATIRLVRQGTDANSVVLLTIKDDGIGIERRKRRSIGVGLSGMEARIRPLGGSLDIATGKKGTLISVSVPG